MNANPLLGVFLHAIGGLAAASFYIPFKRVRKWSWESYWLTGGVFSWIFAPWIFAMLTVQDLPAVLSASPISSICWTYFFGVLWGIGGLTFGLSMRYLGLSLGYSLALGNCAIVGTLVPPIYGGKLLGYLQHISGQVTVGGVFVCLAGIVICARAGILKEAGMSEEEKKASIAEFNWVKGFWVALLAGLLSACMHFAFVAGKPIAEAARAAGASSLFQNNAIWVIVLAGGFTTNAVWCLFLNYKNNSWSDYVSADGASLIINYVFSALAGVTWYFQFFFYGMGETRMGYFGFASWTLHMAFIIIFSNLWAIFFKEWKGAGRAAVTWIYAGIAVLLLSTIVVGWGTYLSPE